MARKVKMKTKKTRNNVNCQLSVVSCNYKAVIFDLGDVYYENGFKKALAKMVLKHTLSESYFKDVFNKTYIKKVEVGKISEKEFWKEFLKDTGLKIPLQKLREQVFYLFKPNPGMKNLVKCLKEKIKVGLLTNNIKDWYKVQEKKDNFKKEFDAVVVSAFIGLRKPCKEIYLLIAKRLGVKPKECIFFDDMLKNVKGARKAGMKAVKFKSAEDCQKQLKKLKVL